MAHHHEQKRRREDEKKIRKNLSITPDTVERIQRFADENDTSFSAAIESFALIGMGEDTTLAFLPILTSQIHRSIASSFNRIAKLAAFAAIEAGQTKEIVKSSLLQDMRRDSDEHGYEFKNKIDVPKNHVSYQAHSKVVNRARVVTLGKLRKPIEELEDILNANKVDEDE